MLKPKQLIKTTFNLTATTQQTCQKKEEMTIKEAKTTQQTFFRIKRADVFEMSIRMLSDL